jgi:hypothetical protein
LNRPQRYRKALKTVATAFIYCGFRDRDETGFMRSVSPGCQFVRPDGETTVRSEERLLKSFA